MKQLIRRNPHNRALVPDPVRAAERSSARRTDPEAVRVSKKAKSGVRSRQKQALPDVATKGVLPYSGEISPVADLNARVAAQVIELRLSTLEKVIARLIVRVDAITRDFNRIMGSREAA